MPLQDTPFGAFAAAYGAYLLLGQRAGEVLMGRWKVGRDVGSANHPLSGHFKTEGACLTTGQIFSTSRMEPRCCHTVLHTVRV